MVVKFSLALTREEEAVVGVVVVLEVADILGNHNQSGTENRERMKKKNENNIRFVRLVGLTNRKE